MNSSKLKLLVILIFLGVNLFFLYNIVKLNTAKTEFTHSEIAQAVEVLNDKGISISEDKVITAKTVPNTLRIEYSADTAETLAKRLMHSEYSSFTIPDGQRFANDKESFSFFNNYSFAYTFTDAPYTEGGIVGKLSGADAEDSEVKEALSAVTKLFSGIQPDRHKTGFAAKRILEEDGTVYLEAVERIDGNEIDGSYVVAAIKDGRIVFVSGRVYLSGKVEDYTSDSHDSINILFEIEKSPLSVDKMEMIYYPVSDKRTALYLAPSYRFTYSDGSVAIYDATSATKRK